MLKIAPLRKKRYPARGARKKAISYQLSVLSPTFLRSETEGRIALHVGRGSSLRADLGALLWGQIKWSRRTKNQQQRSILRTPDQLSIPTWLAACISRPSGFWFEGAPVTSGSFHFQLGFKSFGLPQNLKTLRSKPECDRLSYRYNPPNNRSAL
jgi:hypothetical protein